MASPSFPSCSVPPPSSVRKPNTVLIRCSSPPITSQLLTLLESNGWNATSDSHVMLGVDFPVGSIFAELTQSQQRSIIVYTDNPRPEYWDNILDAGASGLIACTPLQTSLVTALQIVQDGGKFRATPQSVSRLTPLERRLLHLNALGLENKRIASCLTIAEGTTRNMLNRIYDKLEVGNRTQAAIYYWGVAVNTPVASLRPAAPPEQ